ncbi:MAG: hypothetical protein JO202_12400 [Ktedonobacteraceae bacterium]|nr:hypothetical protein [Ktedonobacteraceae bacterium]
MTIGRPATTNAFPSQKFYWGQQAQWGPFSAEASGRPNAAEVLRDGMQRANLGIKEVLERYNQEMVRLGKHPISLSRMYRMTRDYTQVPEDITRREALARVFQVSPILLGVVPVEEFILKPESQKKPFAVPTVLKYASLDLEHYEHNVQHLWYIFDTGTVQDVLDEKAIVELETIEQRTRDKAQLKTQELLHSYARLAALDAGSDRGRYANAVRYAEKAIAAAERMQDEELLSAGWYARGYRNLVWGRVWKLNEHGLLVLSREKIREAIIDFDKALGRIGSGNGHSTVTSRPHPQLKGRLLLEQARALSLIKDEDPHLYEAKARANIDLAATLIGKDPLDDHYLRCLLTGSFSGGFNNGTYRLVQAVTLKNLEDFEEAADSIDELEDLSGDKGIRKNQTRLNGWSLIIHAQAAFGQGDYFTAAHSAKRALQACGEIRSRSNIMLIQDIYARLLKTGYKLELIDELGQELARYYQASNSPRKSGTRR